jgi:hypothetical protein
MSGKTTADRIAAAEQGAMSNRPAAPQMQAQVQPRQAMPVLKPQQQFVDARQREIDAATARDRAAIIERNRRMSLRSK